MNDSFPCIWLEASTFAVEDRLQNVCSIIQLFIVFCLICLAFSFLVAQRKPHSALLAFSMAKRHTFFFKFVQWKIKTKQFLAELRLLHPGVRFYRTAGLFLRRTS